MPSGLLKQSFDGSFVSERLVPVWEQLKASSYAEYLMRRTTDEPSTLRALTWQHVETNLTQARYCNPWIFCTEFDSLLSEIAGLADRSKDCSQIKDNVFKLRLLFASLVGPVMRDEFGYCCAEVHRNKPPTALCSGAGDCRIRLGDVFYSVAYAVGKYPQVYSFCVKHFNNTEKLVIGRSDTGPIWAPKEDFQLCIQSEVRAEETVECSKCGIAWHKICALYTEELFPDGFLCDRCRYDDILPVIAAKDLQRTELSDSLESRLCEFYGQLSEKDPGLLPASPTVFIRVVNCAEDRTQAPESMRKIYENEHMPYRTKTVFAFETVGDRDVCFFGFIVQEYGSDCPEPNRGCVFISYLGSLKYPVYGDGLKGIAVKNVVEPDANNNVDNRMTVLRTQTYHEILLGYMEYAKCRGYHTCYITAVPPQPEENYIFPHHPPSMKFPDEDRLLAWYGGLIERGKTDGIVLESTDLCQVAKQKEFSPSEIPFFCGDVRSHRMSEVVAQVEQKLSKTLKRKGHAGNRVLRDLLGEIGHLTLVLKLRALKLDPNEHIVDPDSLMPSELLSSCDNFVYYATEARWAFSSLRRAQYATAMIAHRLHKERESNGQMREADADEVQLVYCDRCSFIAKHSCSECEQDFCAKCAANHVHCLTEIEAMKPIRNE